MRTTRLYPVSLRIDGAPCLVVGGGSVALRKVRGLIAAGARVRVVSPELPRRPSGVAWAKRRFRPADVRGMSLVFAATDDPGVNIAVAEACRREGVPVNVADAPHLCTFQVPSVVRRGALTLAVSTGGASPALARRLKRRLSDLVAVGYDRLAAEIGRLRHRAMEQVPDPDVRRRLLRKLASDEVLSRLERTGFASAKQALRRIWTEAAR